MNITADEYKEIALQALEDLYLNPPDLPYPEYLRDAYLFLKRLIDNAKFNRVS